MASVTFSFESTPSDFEVDMNGKRYSWQGIAKLPFIDEARLLAAVAKVQQTLTEEEKRRNTAMSDMLFVSKSHPLSQNIYSLDSLLSGQELKKGVAEPNAKLTPHLGFDEMYGSIWRSVGGTCPPILKSPIADMENITNNQVLCVNYKLPKTMKRIAKTCTGVIFPEKIVKPENLKPEPGHWHEDSRNRRPSENRRPNPSGSISGPQLGIEAHRLVLKSLQLRLGHQSGSADPTSRAAFPYPGPHIVATLAAIGKNPQKPPKILKRRPLKGSSISSDNGKQKQQVNDKNCPQSELEAALPDTIHEGRPINGKVLPPLTLPPGGVASHGSHPDEKSEAGPAANDNNPPQPYKSRKRRRGKGSSSLDNGEQKQQANGKNCPQSAEVQAAAALPTIQEGHPLVDGALPPPLLLLPPGGGVVVAAAAPSHGSHPNKENREGTAANGNSPQEPQKSRKRSRGKDSIKLNNGEQKQQVDDKNSLQSQLQTTAALPDSSTTVHPTNGEVPAPLALPNLAAVSSHGSHPDEETTAGPSVNDISSPQQHPKSKKRRRGKGGSCSLDNEQEDKQQVNGKNCQQSELGLADVHGEEVLPSLPLPGVMDSIKRVAAV